MNTSSQIDLYLDSARESDTISLGYAQMKSEELETVAKFVGDNPFVKYLDLRGNNIRADGARALAAAIKQNRSIISLRLMHNAIGEDIDGLQALCTVLQPNLSITHVDLCDNKIDEAGAKIVGGMLAANTAITHIDLAWNHFGEAGGTMLVNDLRHSKQILDVQVCGSGVGVDILNEITFMLRHNYKKLARREQEQVEEAEAAEPSSKAKEKAKSKAKPKKRHEPTEVVAPPTQWKYEDFCKLQRQLQAKQREQKVPADRAIFKEVSFFMDSTLLETKRHLAKYCDGRQRENVATTSFRQRELRYTREISQIEHMLIDNLGAREGLVQKNKWKREEVERAKSEIELEEKKDQVMQERTKKEQRKMREQIAEVEGIHSELRDKMLLLSEDLRSQAEENERLREYVKNFKGSMNEILG